MRVILLRVNIFFKNYQKLQNVRKIHVTLVPSKNTKKSQHPGTKNTRVPPSQNVRLTHWGGGGGGGGCAFNAK